LRPPALHQANWLTPAADFPGRAVTFVVPGPVGGITDALCRIIAEKLG
jgi:tripartite-type tricarboxylate transporter receptor subunit TctC